MKLHLKKKETIRDIQKEFNGYFPYLKIEFFRSQHTVKKLSPKDEKLDEFTPLSKLVSWHGSKEIEIGENMTVSQFEAIMSQKAELFVQVFRQAGRIWIETSFTDNWTLAQQNEEGKMMSSIHDVDSEKQVGWDEWEIQ